MVFKKLGAALVASALLAGAACNSSSEPKKTFNICVHAQGEPFTPGSTGLACSIKQIMRAGQTKTVELETDLYSGDARTATVAILFNPNGWTVSLGGSAIDVPGKQTLTLTIPSNAITGDYTIAVRATSMGESVILAFTIGVTAAV